LQSGRSSPRPIAAPRQSLPPPPAKSIVQERLEAENKSLQEDLSRLKERMDAMEMSLRDTQPPIVKRYVDSLGRIKELETVSELAREDHRITVAVQLVLSHLCEVTKK
jgi:phosphoenolpyruvate carboxylase